MSGPTLSALYVYPIKSCRGIELDTAVITPTGVLFDRNWVIVKADSGKFITQRHEPKLALVEVSVVPEQLLRGAVDIAACPDAKLVLRAPGMPELQVPIAPPPADKPQVPVTVWAWSGLAADEGEAAAAWLTSYLGKPARLLRYAGQAGGAGSPEAAPQRRPVSPDWAPQDGFPYETAFADGFQFLLANQASLEDLNRCLEAKGEHALPLNRFRPNFLLTGAGAWEEHGWRSVRVGGKDGGEDGVTLTGIKPCSRCKVTTIDQATGEEGLEPLVTLREIQSGRVLGWEGILKNEVFFGWNMACKQRGVVRVGDSVAVTELREGAPAPNPPPVPV